MKRLKPIVTEGNTALYFKAVGRFIASAIAVPIIMICLCGNTAVAQDEELSFGVMVNSFEFYRPYKLPESEDLADLKSRRRQLTDMISDESKRLASAQARTQGFIKDHIK